MGVETTAILLGIGGVATSLYIGRYTAALVIATGTFAAVGSRIVQSCRHASPPQRRNKLRMMSWNIEALGGSPYKRFPLSGQYFRNDGAGEYLRRGDEFIAAISQIINAINPEICMIQEIMIHQPGNQANNFNGVQEFDRILNALEDISPGKWAGALVSGATHGESYGTLYQKDIGIDLISFDFDNAMAPNVRDCATAYFRMSEAFSSLADGNWNLPVTTLHAPSLGNGVPTVARAVKSLGDTTAASRIDLFPDAIVCGDLNSDPYGDCVSGSGKQKFIAAFRYLCGKDFVQVGGNRPTSLRRIVQSSEDAWNGDEFDPGNPEAFNNNPFDHIYARMSKMGRPLGYTFNLMHVVTDLESRQEYYKDAEPFTIEAEFRDEIFLEIRDIIVREAWAIAREDLKRRYFSDGYFQNEIYDPEETHIARVFSDLIAATAISDHNPVFADFRLTLD